MSAERKALLVAAIEAVKAARDACVAAGLVEDGGWYFDATPTMLDKAEARAQSALDLIVATETPIAIGDKVRVSTGRGGWESATLKVVGRAWIAAGNSRYSIDRGERQNWSQYHIHLHDLARIQRWLVKPAKVKP